MGLSRGHQLHTLLTTAHNRCLGHGLEGITRDELIASMSGTEATSIGDGTPTQVRHNFNDRKDGLTSMK